MFIIAIFVGELWVDEVYRIKKCFTHKKKKAPIPVLSRLLTISKESYIDFVPIDELVCGTYLTQFLLLR
ncbi:hypothetical protein COE51_01835 [Bacillus pseudomycoides]|nr:hypothetical protein COE51_01835 [Bacillus pseudomycoides]